MPRRNAFQETTRQQRAKSGPVYERVVKGQLRYWIREAERLGIEVAEALE